MRSRRSFVAAMLGLGGLPWAARAAPAYPVVVPGQLLRFPEDFGSHPSFRTEWWYITAWLTGATGAPRGMQITFFRHRPGVGEDSASAFAPRQLLLAHAAVADPASGRLLHAQRAARAGFGLAEAMQSTTDVHIDDWLLRRRGDGYHLRVAAPEFAFALVATATQPPLLQGDGGYSRKGPLPEQASYYYSEPQLAVSGSLTLGARAETVTGRAWCDHEWSSEYLPSTAVGWDWTGINLDDGGALMAFVMRSRARGVLWAGGSLRPANGRSHAFSEREVRFTPRRTWRSPRTQVEYPVATTVALGDAAYDLEPLFDDQELDARASTGTIYWEGAVRALREGREVGRGYLELTGYAGRLRM